MAWFADMCDLIQLHITILSFYLQVLSWTVAWWIQYSNNDNNNDEDIYIKNGFLTTFTLMGHTGRDNQAVGPPDRTN